MGAGDGEMVAGERVPSALPQGRCGPSAGQVWPFCRAGVALLQGSGGALLQGRCGPSAGQLGPFCRAAWALLQGILHFSLGLSCLNMGQCWSGLSGSQSAQTKRRWRLAGRSLQSLLQRLTLPLAMSHLPAASGHVTPSCERPVEMSWWKDIRRRLVWP